MLNDLSLYMHAWSDLGLPLWHYVICFCVTFGLYVAGATWYAIRRADACGYSSPDYATGIVLAVVVTWTFGVAVFAIVTLSAIAAAVGAFILFYKFVNWVASHTIDRIVYRYLSNRKAKGEE